MATTTPNFGWAVPTSSDLVKNGATAIETLGDAIDASLVDLKGGTTGQVLAKATNTDMDFTWSTPSSGGGMTLLASGSLSGSSVDLTSISQSYVDLQLYIDNVVMSTSNESVKVEVNAGGNNHFYSTSLNNTTLAASATNSNMFLTSGNLTNAQSAMLQIFNYTSTYAKLIFSEGYTISANNRSIQFGSISGTGAITSIKLLPSGGTFTGNYKLYGVK